MPPHFLGALHLDQAGRSATLALARVSDGPPVRQETWTFPHTRDWDDYPLELLTCPFIALGPLCRRVFAFRPKNWTFDRPGRPEDGRHWAAALMGFMMLLPVSTIELPGKLCNEAKVIGGPVVAPLDRDSWIAHLLQAGRQALGVT